MGNSNKPTDGLNMTERYLDEMDEAANEANSTHGGMPTVALGPNSTIMGMRPIASIPPPPIAQEPRVNLSKIGLNKPVWLGASGETETSVIAREIPIDVVEDEEDEPHAVPHVPRIKTARTKAHYTGMHEGGNVQSVLSTDEPFKIPPVISTNEYEERVQSPALSLETIQETTRSKAEKIANEWVRLNEREDWETELGALEEEIQFWEPQIAETAAILAKLQAEPAEEPIVTASDIAAEWENIDDSIDDGWGNMLDEDFEA